MGPAIALRQIEQALMLLDGDLDKDSLHVRVADISAPGHKTHLT